MRIGFVIAHIRNDRVTPWPSRKRAGTVLDSKQILIGVGAAVAAIALNWLIGKLLGLQRKKAAQAAGQVILDRADQDA